MTTSEQFKENNYLIKRGLLGQELVKNLEFQFKMLRDIAMYQTNNNKEQFYDTLVTDNCFSWYGVVDHLLLFVKPTVEELTGYTLTPTYTFGRIYYKNAIMKKHVDRPSCEISTTINISIDKTPWPIWIKNNDGIDIPVELFPGDALIYKGEILPHWRNPYVEGEEQVQFFLHWVDSNGPHTGQQFDRRDMLGLPGIPQNDH
jgi:hypothetical protein